MNFLLLIFYLWLLAMVLAVLIPLCFAGFLIVLAVVYCVFKDNSHGPPSNPYERRMAEPWNYCEDPADPMFQYRQNVLANEGVEIVSDGIDDRE